MQIEQLTCNIGAELSGVKLADAIYDDGLFAEIRTQHYAVMDYPPCHRKMERAGIIGDATY